ncbi:sulfotransferase family protein [Ekhidna sp. To15]|uniref:sulfotransferase-like domain-containing protein n=1 Tax=Ekhidna sp. To15 TaxID=3395267 RepID=UPI003F52714E
MIINLISGPRNISTALMYSFSQHSKIKVVDEPFYAHYLVHTGIDHPGRDETISSMSANSNDIISQIKSLEKEYEIVFLKNMAHHHEGLDWSYLKEIHNVFLIRDPKQLIASFAQVIEQPTLQDIGLKHEADLLDYVVEFGAYPAIVIDSNDILKNPETELSRLCKKLGIPFENQMLSWEKGAIPDDGSWAKFWYKNVHNSTGFTKQKTSERTLPESCKTLYSNAIPHYEKLKNYKS